MRFGIYDKAAGTAAVRIATVPVALFINRISCGFGVTATFRFARQDGGNQQSGEDERANLFEASGFSGVVVDLFGNDLCGDNPVE